MHWHLVGRGQECRATAYNAHKSPQQRGLWDKMSIGLRLRNPAWLTEGHLGARLRIKFQGLHQMQPGPLRARSAAQARSLSGLPQGRPGRSRGLKARGEWSPATSEGTVNLYQRHPQSDAFQGEPLAASCVISWPWWLCFREPGEVCGSMPRVPTPFLPVCLAFAVQNWKLIIHFTGWIIQERGQRFAGNGWHHRNRLYCLQKRAEKGNSTAKLVSGPKWLWG